MHHIVRHLKSIVWVASWSARPLNGIIQWEYVAVVLQYILWSLWLKFDSFIPRCFVYDFIVKMFESCKCIVLVKHLWADILLLHLMHLNIFQIFSRFYFIMLCMSPVRECITQTFGMYYRLVRLLLVAQHETYNPFELYYKHVKLCIFLASSTW